jgi:hypothetical protein
LGVFLRSNVESFQVVLHVDPTVPQSTMMAAGACEGTITDLYLPRKWIVSAATQASPPLRPSFRRARRASPPQRLEQ